MSYVCEILIFASILEDEVARGAELNAIVSDEACTSGGQRLLLASDNNDWYGGSKAWQGTLWAGAVNYLDHEHLLRELPTAVKWEHPREVRIVLMQEHDDVPQMLKLGEPYDDAIGRVE